MHAFQFSTMIIVVILTIKLVKFQHCYGNNAWNGIGIAIIVWWKLSTTALTIAPILLIFAVNYDLPVTSVGHTQLNTCCTWNRLWKHYNCFDSVAVVGTNSSMFWDVFHDHGAYYYYALRRSCTSRILLFIVDALTSLRNHTLIKVIAQYGFHLEHARTILYNTVWNDYILNLFSEIFSTVNRVMMDCLGICIHGTASY